MSDSGRRATRSWTQLVPAPPAEVFPLLCPVREYEWIASWGCEMIHSRSGVAEKGCVFTRTDETGPATWVVSRYEPDRRIDFVIVTPASHIQHLEIKVAADHEGSRLTWTRTLTTLEAAGDAALDALEDGTWDARMAGLERALQHYCITGEMLRSEN